MFLSAGFGCSNRRRMTDLTVDSELFHQVHKPLHRPSRFDPYAHRTWKRGIKLPHAVAFVRESLVHNFSRRGVQHRQRLLASMQVTSYNPHLGLLRSEHCWGEHRTVYSGRREADVVMTSIRSCGASVCVLTPAPWAMFSIFVQCDSLIAVVRHTQVAALIIYKAEPKGLNGLAVRIHNGEQMPLF